MKERKVWLFCHIGKAANFAYCCHIGKILLCALLGMEYIAECYEKRIVLSQIEQGAVFDQYEDPLFWLGDSMICNLYSLDTGRVYCEYPMISFEMKSVKVSEAKTERVIDDYDELKAWWQNEN